MCKSLSGGIHAKSINYHIIYCDFKSVEVGQATSR